MNFLDRFLELAADERDLKKLWWHLELEFPGEVLLFGSINGVLQELCRRWWASTLENLKTETPPERIHQRIECAVMAYISTINPHRKALRHLGLRPQHLAQPLCASWSLSDEIWHWAGDQSLDFNYYTKRGLLTAVIITTLTYWLYGPEKSPPQTRDFLQKRLKNVLGLGKIIGHVRSLIGGIGGKLK